ncbi:protein nutcracker-like isoform X16 [Drosophila subpulchrella]|uniref:protein nutcracker-like isoform X16 n=1 Tax=Drosophila subpulchrella TaxID=1486046 RepID=UPI0018A194AD|nr:protein nutcracker-like isoform X16 [Drosophila subpulchrella]
MSEAKSEIGGDLAGPSTSGEQRQQSEPQVVATKDTKAPDQVPKKQRQRLVSEKSSPEPNPLILEHANLESVPQHMEKLLKQYQENRKMPAAEWLNLLIYLLALECGFVEEETYAQKRHLIEPVPSFSSFHALNVRLLSEQPANYVVCFNDTAYSMRLRTLLDHHTSEEASVVSALQSRLMAITLGDQLMVTLSPAPPSQQPGYSISLPIGRYVLNVQAKNKPIYHRFRKLDELSYQLKQHLFQPMRSQQLMQMEQKLQPSLLGLPYELYDEIFRYLNKSQLNVVAKVNRQLQLYTKETERKRQLGSRS